MAMQNVYVSVKTPAGDDLQLHAFRGEEEMSVPFRFELDLVSKKKDIDFKKLLGKEATLTVVLPDDTKRYISGLVTRFTQAGNDGVHTHYRAEVRPWLALLAMTSDNRIFQKKKTPEILEAVFQDLGFTDFKNSLKGVYQPREYCVQYQESTLSFVSRLMEDEGIFYFFDHADGKHTLVLADDSDAHPKCLGKSKIPIGAHRYLDPILECHFDEQITTNLFALTDYDFEVPKTDLFVKTGSGKPKLRWYDHPGLYVKKDDGDSRVKLRIESREQAAKVLHGRGHARALASGHKFTLAEHPRADLNQDYVVRKVEHSGTLYEYENYFEALPASVPFRPPQRTDWPRIAGSQTALVVGKSGEEIWTDKYGRIKVQFHWDRQGKKDENSSVWIRVAHSWAGKGYGTVFIPRIGQEVVVSFLDGNPDRPLVTGVVYNADQTVPYALPDNQTRSTMKTKSSKQGDGYNELRFEDKKDDEEIFLHAAKDFNQVIENDKTVEIENDETITVKNDQKVTIKKNRTTEISEEDETLSVKKGKRTITVDKGDEEHTVGGKRSVTVKKAETHSNKKKFTHEVEDAYELNIKKDLTINVDGNIKIVSKKKITIEGKGGIKVSSDQDIGMEAKMNFKTEAKMELAQKAGTTLKAEGTMVEVKASATGKVDGGGMLSLKGGMVKLG